LAADELLKLEHDGWKALCDGTGPEFYGRIMAEDGIMVLAHGQAMERGEVVESLRDAPPWESYEIADEKWIPLGPDQELIVYTGRASRSGGQPDFMAIMSSVYVRRGEGWKLALYQQTPVPVGE